MRNMDAARPNFEKLQADLRSFRKKSEHDDSVQLAQFNFDLAKKVVQAIPSVGFEQLVALLQAAGKVDENFAKASLSTKKGIIWGVLDNFIDELQKPLT